ncbi:hypothetical protein LX77_03109 [Gelidibacter algens]|uniref:Uncharacterized protein n=1 Tax=Gelidibacter algens TaxID=49280 RepID=A0A327RV95_9FLAO|nr:hypothetical protein LX77_03109 [Gelidibacter algens]
MAWSMRIWKIYGYPKLVYIWRGSCFNTPQLIYINVSTQLSAQDNTDKRENFLIFKS